MYDSYFLRFEHLYVLSGHHCVEGREVTCNLYTCDKPCNISPNRTPLLLFGTRMQRLVFYALKQYCRQSITTLISNNIVIASNLYNSMHFVKCVGLLNILNTKTLKEIKQNVLLFTFLQSNAS